MEDLNKKTKLSRRYAAVPVFDAWRELAHWTANIGTVSTFG
jgi:hypothetical protein